VAELINRRAIRWLRAQLPGLVAGGVITADNAAAIDRHYAATESRSTNFGFVILAGIGSTLVGAGIILLIAHNWDELSRPVRCILAFLPLVCALSLGFFVLLRRNDSAPWREAAAIFDVAAVGTAISLVSQTYQIQGSFAEFMRIWLLLSIPIVYLFRTNFGALAYIIGTTVWVINKSFWSSVQPGEAFFWVFLLLVVFLTMRWLLGGVRPAGPFELFPLRWSRLERSASELQLNSRELTQAPWRSRVSLPSSTSSE
jgi:uncharacterized membrane protein